MWKLALSWNLRGDLESEGQEADHFRVDDAGLISILEVMFGLDLWYR
jgi:hypothetical protein